MTWVGFDIETAGEQQEYALQPWRGKHRQAWVRTFVEATAQRNNAVVRVTDQYMAEQLQATVRRWLDTQTTVCVWNGVFEVAWLANYVPHNLLRRVKWLDGMLLWRHLENVPEYDIAANKRRSFGLKAAVAHFLPQYAGYDEGVDFDGDLMTLLRYNTQDSVFTRIITRYLYLQLQEQPERLRAALIESRCIADIGLANYHGIDVDVDALAELDVLLSGTAQEKLTLLEQHGATKTILASPLQLRGLLFERWGLKPIKQGKTGASTDKETLHELSLKDERVALIGEYREARNNRTKFVANLRQATKYNNDSLAHPQARLFGTYSGRLTYSSSQGTGKAKRQIGWALHQMKRSAEFRSLIRAPKGYSVVEFDAAGQEFRWMAIVARDETMLSLCMPGEDAHAFMGARISGAPYDEVRQGAKEGDKALKQVRHLGKVANLSLQYRTSANKLLSVARVQYGMDMDIFTATKIHRTYLTTYRRVPMYWQQQIDHINQYLFVATLAGRRVCVDRKTIVKHTWSTQSTSINFPVQGTGADQKALGISMMRKLLERYDARFLFDLHDGLFYVVPNDVVKDFIADGLSVLDNLPYEQAWGFEPPIPLPFDAKYGPTWGEMVEL